MRDRARRRIPESAPRIAALATAVPPHILGQPEVAVRARHLFAESAAVDIERLLPVFANAGIDRRYSCVPIDWYDAPHGWTERNALYIDNALELLERAARDCLERAGLEPRDVDAIVTVSTTGIATPSLDAILVGRLGLRSDVRRLPVFGLGCAGGVLGLTRAGELARAAPQSRVLFLVVELCALCFRKNDRSKSNIVATALFGDGAAAALISCQGQGPALLQSAEHIFPDTLDIMGWEVTEEGLKAIFSRDIPTLVRERMRALVDDFLAANGLAIGDIRHFVCHPGGAKVIVALEECFDRGAGALDSARTVLRDYGNMSAASVMFVLDRTLKAGASGRMLMTSLGPGFTAGFLLLDAA